MKKKLAALLVLALQFSLSSAFAAGSFEKIYTVESAGSAVETQKYSGVHMLPVLYLRVPENGFVFRTLRWNAPSGAFYTQNTGVDNNRDTWVSPNNWNTIAEAGTWTVNASYFYQEAPVRLGSSTYSFQVNPEPSTIILFLLGAAAFAFYHFAKQRKVTA